MATRTVISGGSGEELRDEGAILAASSGGLFRALNQRGQVVPGVGHLDERVQAPEALGLLARLHAAQRLVEHARAVRLQHPEVEAEAAPAHEMARRGARERAAHTLPLVL